MPEFKVGDTVVHEIYGSGTIVAIDDKGTQGRPCFYYVIESQGQTLWVPVEGNGRSSLHQPTSAQDFQLLIHILRSRGEDLSNQPYRRLDQLDERMQNASPKGLCLVIRDLNHRSHSRKLNSHDTRVMSHAQNSMLDEWERSLGTSRERARRELESILNFRSSPFAAA